MARYQPYDVPQGKVLPLSLADHILPGSFESTLHELVEQPLDLALFAPQSPRSRENKSPGRSRAAFSPRRA
jgi:hypothetical protein